jgi:hypothetical protein
VVVTKNDFTILRHWRITKRRSKKYHGQIFIHNKLPKATIYLLKTNEPEDFELHEYLHCAIRALLRMDKRSPKELRIAEENLIMDICNLFTRKEEENGKGY